MSLKERLLRKDPRDRIQKLERQKKAAQIALAEISRKAVQDERLRLYLEEFATVLDKQIHFLQTVKCIGNRLTRKLFKDPERSYCGELISIFKTGGGMTVGNITLPFPVNQADEWTVGDEFIDILLPYLFEQNQLEFDACFYDEGPYEIENVSLHENDIVLDCGANVGMFSALASVRGCKVFAFEPMEYTIRTYLAKTAELHRNIEIVPFALSDETGETLFQLDGDNIAASREQKENSDAQVQTQKVRMTTIDGFVREKGLERVDFIKADIEGAERHMLLGAKETIRRFSPNIAICTYHLPDDPKVLREILLSIQPRYKIIEKYKKMYAYME